MSKLTTEMTCKNCWHLLMIADPLLSLCLIAISIKAASQLHSGEGAHVTFSAGRKIIPWGSNSCHNWTQKDGKTRWPYVRNEAEKNCMNKPHSI